MASAALLTDINNDYRDVRPSSYTLDSHLPKAAPRYVGDQPEVHRVPTGLAPGLCIETSVPPIDGLVDAVMRLHELKALPQGWDSYSALPVSEDAFRPALELVLLSLHRCSKPRITAASSGGIMLIWEAGQRELEIEVEPAGTYGLYFSDEASGEELDPWLWPASCRCEGGVEPILQPRLI